MMNYFLASGILVFIVLIIVSFIIPNEKDTLLVLALVVGCGILVIGIKYLFEYYGFSINPNDYKYTWTIGFIIGLIVLIIGLFNSENTKESCFVSVLALIFVSAIIGLDEVFSYAFGNENMRQEVMSKNYFYL